MVCKERDFLHKIHHVSYMWQVVPTCKLKDAVLPGAKGRSVWFRWHLPNGTSDPRGCPKLGLCKWQNQINGLCKRWEFLSRSFRLSSLSFRWLGTFCFCNSGSKSQQVTCRVCVYSLPALVSVTNTSVSSWQEAISTKNATNQALLLIFPLLVL